MVENKQPGPFWSLYESLKAGKISRREFFERALALGVSASVLGFVMNSVKLEGAAAAPAAQDAPNLSVRPADGTEGQTRGAGGELKILQWQGATTLNVLAQSGTKDALAASLVTEPLTSYAADGTLIPTLITEVPTLDNGLLSEDLLTVTYKLIPGVLWSDGQPFTADDVVFTFNWINDPINASTSTAIYESVESVTATDPETVTVKFKSASLGWYVPFSGSYNNGILPKHFWDGKDPKTANDEFLKAPLGTGPYVVTSFAPNDNVQYTMNENYREPNKPFFSSVNIKGGGEATSAAQAVLQTGEFDVAWNLQVEQPILDKMASEGGKGKVLSAKGTNVERVFFNFSDPDDESQGERASLLVPHPFLTDKAVRQAISLATDRDTIASQFYAGGDVEPPGRNILTGIGAYESPNTAYEFNLDKAAQVLEEAGWVMDGDVRKKDGVELSVKYFTSINAVRQKTQQVNKANWEKVGIKTSLGTVDAGVYFDSAAGNDQTASHFFRDIEMFTNGSTSTWPQLYMSAWYAGPDPGGPSGNVAQKANGWSGQNIDRYVNPDYDVLFEAVLKETVAEKAAEMFIQMNDIIINDYVEIPLVQRVAEKWAILNNVRDNFGANPFETLYWNIANWNRVEG
jgi:peptide/nickel transport system substrate-binding protein